MALSCARMRFGSACSHTLAVPNRRKSDGDAADEEEAEADGAGTDEAGGGEETEGATALALPPVFALSTRVDACDASEMESSDGRLSCGEERASVSASAVATAAGAVLGPPSPLLLIRLTTPDEETIAIDDEDDEECTGEDAVELLMENTALVLGRLEGADARVLESMADVNGVGANHCDGVTSEEKNEPTADVDGGGGGTGATGAGTDCEAAGGGTERMAGGLVMVGASKVDLVDAAAGSGIKGCSAR